MYFGHQNGLESYTAHLDARSDARWSQSVHKVKIIRAPTRIINNKTDSAFEVPA